ncbi:MAG TPA: hypothetical protein VIR38_09595 [Thalassobaculum sp.]
MTSRPHAEHDRPHSSLDPGFVQGVSWPVPESALAALVDMGLSDDRIGRYFRVEAGEVRRRRERADRRSAPFENAIQECS